MPWDDSANAGFTTGTPWIQAADHYKTINVKNDLSDPDGIFAYYQKLIQMRKTMPVVQTGLFQPLLEDHPSIFAYERVLGNEKMIVLNNFYGKEAECDIDADGMHVFLSNYADTEAQNHMVLRPYESVILYNR